MEFNTRVQNLMDFLIFRWLYSNNCFTDGQKGQWKKPDQTIYTYILTNRNFGIIVLPVNRPSY